MKIPMLDRIEKYLAEDAEAKRLLGKGFEFITDWTFFPTMAFATLQKETNRLIADFTQDGYTDLTIHFIESQFIGIWGKKP